MVFAPTSGSAAGSPAKAGSQENAIEQAREDLKTRGIDSARMKLTVTGPLSGAAYFTNRPENEYWDAGRAAVGKSSFYLVTFSEPTKSLGGTHQYFFDSAIHKLLWIARAK